MLGFAFFGPSVFNFIGALIQSAGMRIYIYNILLRHRRISESQVTSLPGWFFLLPLDDGSSRLSRRLEEVVEVSLAELTVLCPS